MQQDNVYWAGVDTAKLSFDAAVADPGRVSMEPGMLRWLPVAHFERTPQGAARFVEWASQFAASSGAAVRVVMEATGAYSVELAAWISEVAPQFAPAIANPRQTAEFIRSLSLRNKTDKLEARALALYGLQRRPAPYEPPTKSRAQLRSLVRYRDTLVQEKVAQGLRASEGSACTMVSRLQKRRLGQLKRDIATVEKEMRRIIEQDPALHADHRMLCTIYGVGFLTAAVVLAELGDLRRFARARQLTAFAGMTPRINQSGTSRYTSHLSKEGNGRVRLALYMAATTSIRGQNDMAITYRQMRQRGMAHKQALVAIMRKLLVIMRAMLIYQQQYEPNRPKIPLRYAA